MKKREATKAAPQSRRIGLVGPGPTSAARDMATGSTRVVLGPRPQWVAEGWGDEEAMADVDEEEEEALREGRDITMPETETENVSRTATDTETEIETGALATIALSDPAQLRVVIPVDYSGAADGSRMQGGRSVHARATKRNRRDWDQPFGIRNKKNKKSPDSDMEGDLLGG
jgi:hypothetical protein